MATVNHADLPNSELHEPKDVSAAAADTCYVADGAGSGDWVAPPYTYSLSVQLTDISTASSAYVVTPKGGTIKKIYSVIDGALATADSALTTYIGGTAITGGGITVAFTGSAAGDSDVATPTALNVLSDGSVFKVTSDGGSTNTVICTVTILVEVVV